MNAIEIAVKIDFTPSAAALLRELAASLGQAGKAAQHEKTWLRMQDFCTKYGIGATLVRRMVKEGRVLKDTPFGERAPLYRLREGVGDVEMAQTAV